MLVFILLYMRPNDVCIRLWNIADAAAAQVILVIIRCAAHVFVFLRESFRLQTTTQIVVLLLGIIVIFEDIVSDDDCNDPDHALLCHFYHLQNFYSSRAFNNSLVHIDTFTEPLLYRRKYQIVKTIWNHNLLK